MPTEMTVAEILYIDLDAVIHMPNVDNQQLDSYGESGLPLFMVVDDLELMYRKSK